MKKPTSTRIRSLTFALAACTLLPSARASAASLSSITCEGLFIATATMPKTHNSIPGIIEELGRKRMAEVITSRECAAFGNACALSSITTGVEALEQFRGSNPAAREILKAEGLKAIEVLKAVTKRTENGLSLGESLGLLRFKLGQRGLRETTTTHADIVAEPTDLALAPNEMMLLATEAAGEAHMVLMFQQNGKRVRAVDPQTGGVEDFEIVAAPVIGSVRLVSTTNKGTTAVLDVFGGIRVTPEKSDAQKPGPRNEMRIKAEMMLQQMLIFREMLDDMHQLSPKASNSPFNNSVDARAFVKEALARLKTAESVLAVKLERLTELESMGVVFELQMVVTDIHQRAAQIGFYDWLRENKLHDVPTVAAASKAQATSPPKWDIKMLEARVSTKFKIDRAVVIEKIDALLAKDRLTTEDLNSGVTRAIQAYGDLVLLAVNEVQVVDAHRLATPLFRRLESLMKSSQMELARRAPQPALMIESNDSVFHQLRAARAKLGVE